MEYYYINDRIVHHKDALISILDLGLLRGYGVFDFFKVHHGVPVFANDHIARFVRSAQSLHLDIPYTPSHIKHLVFDLIEKNSIQDGSIKLVLTGGISSNGFNLDGPSGFVMIPSSLSFKIYTTIEQMKSCRLMSLNYVRETPEIKSLNYLIPMLHWPSVVAGGYDDVLYVHQGYISETSRANIFFITRDNILVTPKQNVLFGITRKYILELAASFMDVEERPISLEEALSCKEAFLSSTTKQVMPVSFLDKNRIDEGHPGVYTKKLFEMFYTFELDHILTNKSHLV